MDHARNESGAKLNGRWTNGENSPKCDHIPHLNYIVWGGSLLRWENLEA